MTQEKLRTIEVSRGRKHRTTNQILSALEVMPFGRHFTAKELATIACQHGQAFVDPNSVNTFLRNTLEGMGLIRTVASDGRAGDSASKAMIACTRNAEGIERVETLLKRLLVKLGEQVD